jgi:hypothetical protein
MIEMDFPVNNLEEITPEQLQTLRHTLGLNNHDIPSRNYFHSGPEKDEPVLMSLKAMGLMDSRKAPAFCHEGDMTFFATESGKAYALARQPTPRVKTLWEHFVSSDMDSFTDFLNIEAPKYEYFQGMVKPVKTPRGVAPAYQEGSHRHKLTRFVRMHSPRGVGDWCLTQKDAKASYKADMQARRKARRLEQNIAA